MGLISAIKKKFSKPKANISDTASQVIEPEKKKLMEIIFSQCQENVNPNYLKEKGMKHWEHFANTVTNGALQEEAYTSDFVETVVADEIDSVNNIITGKVLSSLEKYFPQEHFSDEIKGFFKPYLKDFLHEAQDRADTIDFGQVCEKLKFLATNSNYFENMFIDACYFGAISDHNLDTEFSAEEFARFRSREISAQEMENLPAIAMEKLTKYKEAEAASKEKYTLLAQDCTELIAKLEQEKIDLLKKRKGLRAQMGREPDNTELKQQFENSKAREQEYVQEIRAAKKELADAQNHASFFARIEGETYNKFVPKFQGMQYYLAHEKEV